MTSELITIWENTDGCVEQYICASSLYIMSVMSQCYSIIIDRGISAPGHGKEVVDGLNSIEKRYIHQWMSNIQLPGSRTFDSQILIHPCRENNDVSLTKQFQKHISKEHRKDGVIDQGKY